MVAKVKEELVEQARAAFTTISSLLEKCADPNCRAELLPEQLKAAISLLSLAVVWGDDIEGARDLVGLRLGQEKGEQARTAASLVAPAIREAVIAYFQKVADARLKLPEEIVAELRNAQPKLDELARLFAKYPEHYKRIAHRVTLATNTQNMARGWLDQSRRSLVVIATSDEADFPKPAAQARCGSDGFLNWFANRNVEQEPIRIPIRVVRALFERTLKQVPCACGGRSECPDDPQALAAIKDELAPGACTAVVGISLTSLGKDRQRADGTLEFFLPRHLKAGALATNDFQSRPFPSTCSTSDLDQQVDAANEFVDRLVGHVDVLIDSPTIDSNLVAIPGFHPGVARKKSTGAMGIDQLIGERGLIVAQSCRPSFDQALKENLLTFEKIIGPIATPQPGAPTLSLRLDGDWCVAELTSQGRTASFWAKPAGKQETWPEAGMDVSTDIGVFYLGTLYGGRPRFDLAGRLPWALASAGVPLLLDQSRNNDIGGALLSTADAALLTTAVYSLWRSQNERSRYARGEADTLRDAQKWYGRGIWAAGVCGLIKLAGVGATVLWGRN